MFIEEEEDPTIKHTVRSAEQREKLLQEEVMDLARRVSEAVLETRPSMVEFVVSGTTIAVETPFVSEVHILRDVTPVPCTPPWVVGIVNIRGQVVAVADIRKVLGLDVGKVLVFNKLVVLQSGENKLGILVDDVLGARIIEDATTVVPIETDSPYARFAQLMTAGGAVILDVPKFVNAQELIVDEEVV